MQKFRVPDTFIKLQSTLIIDNFITSLKSYTDNSRSINAAFEDLKYEELLLILLQNQPELAGLFFDYASPQKIDLKKFMNNNYKFNVRLKHFAYLTGPSLSVFKKNFKIIFLEAPNRWLIKRLLQAAYILIGKQNKKASKIYLDLGFEDLSHFSLAFKKQFGLRLTELTREPNRLNK